MAKIETQSDNLLGNDNFTRQALDELTDYLLDKGNLCEEVDKKLNEASGGNKGDTTVLDTSGIGTALSESLMQLQMRNPIAASDIPTFNGETSEFVPYLESFDYLVDSNDSIPDSMKATYLKKTILIWFLFSEQIIVYYMIDYLLGIMLKRK